MTLKPTHLVPAICLTILTAHSIDAADIDSRTRSFDRRTRSFIRTGPPRAEAATRTVERTETVEHYVVEKTNRRVGLDPADAEALAAVPAGGKARLMTNTMRLAPPGAPPAQTTTIRKVVETRTFKDVVSDFKPWEVEFESTTDVTYDSNALTEPDAEQDWIFNQTVGLTATYAPREESPWALSFGGDYTLSRYNRFSSEDLDVLTLGVRWDYEFSDSLSAFIRNRVQWFYSGFFDESLTARNRLDAGLKYQFNKAISATGKVDRFWFDHAGRDRTEFSVTALYEWDNKTSKDQKDRYWSAGVGLTFVYANYDSDRERIDLAPEFEIAYQATENVAIKLKAGYNSTDDSDPDADFEQFVALPSIVINAKW